MTSVRKEFTHLGIGLIYRPTPHGNQYLVCQLDNADVWTPFISERLERESFRETVTREIAWQLDLDRDKDFVVSNMAVGSHEFVEKEFNVDHHVAIAFYRARLFTEFSRNKIESNANCRWVSSKELCAGQLEDGQPFDSDFVDWVNRWSVIRPWE